MKDRDGEDFHRFQGCQELARQDTTSDCDCDTEADMKERKARVEDALSMRRAQRSRRVWCREAASLLLSTDALVAEKPEKKDVGFRERTPSMGDDEL